MSEVHLPRSPLERFGPLFEAVQDIGLFPDSKTFADAVPRRHPDAILSDWREGEPHDAQSLRAFVDKNFDLPPNTVDTLPETEAIDRHIDQLWQILTRHADSVPRASSALQLPRPFVIPGGRFRELYYWDSYFTMLGLQLSGRQDLVEDNIENFGSLLDRYGRIPNGARSYYLSRSHPPVFYLAAGLSRDQSPQATSRRLGWMLKEHAFWMAGADSLLPGEEGARVVRLGDGTLLNRYWDDRATPRDESWREDKALAKMSPAREPAELWRDLRAAAESGWDFSSRWFGDAGTLGSIRTTRLLPIDLNSLLYGLECAIVAGADAQGETTLASDFRERAQLRAQAIERYFWNEDAGYYADYDLDLAETRSCLTAAAGFPMFCGVSSRERARQNARAISKLVCLGGLATTLAESGEQWDAPNGWAPLQWITFEALRRYGEHALAEVIASRWIAVVTDQFDATGQIFEKYNVMTGTAGGGGEYAVEVGFGWTIGVLLALRGSAPSQSHSR